MTDTQMTDTQMIEQLEAEQSMFVQTAQRHHERRDDPDIEGGHPVDALLLRSPETDRRDT